MKFDPVNDYQVTILTKSGCCPGPDDSVLDAGCGRGDNAVYFAQSACDVTGIDIEPWDEWKTHKKKNLKFKKADIHHLPFKNRQFSTVFTKDTLHHVDDPEKALRELKRVTKKGGRIYVVESNRYNPVFYIHMTKMLGHEHFSRKRFTSIIGSVGGAVTYTHVESRVYPVPNAFIHRVLHTVESVIEKLPIINVFTSYNIAIIRNV